MRRHHLLPLIIALAAATTAGADTLLLQPIEIVDPGLQAAVLATDRAGDCSVFSPGQLCGGLSSHRPELFQAADGTTYIVTEENMDGVCGPASDPVHRFWRVGTDKSVREVLRLARRCLTCSGGTCVRQTDTTQGWFFDPVSGTLNFRGAAQIRQQTLEQQELGWVRISGFPTLFDTVLTFTPGASGVSALVPAMPDGFTAADSLQLYAGDIGALPDWSRAEALDCGTGINPSPGQRLDFAAVPPDPQPGRAVYVLAASQDGAERRAGRQYVNGILAARDASRLPRCP